MPPTVGSAVYYVCAACPPPNNGLPPKNWPRLDNFKAHTSRKHGDWDQQYLIRMSKHMPPSMAQSESGYGSHMPVEYRDTQSLGTPSMSRGPSFRGGNFDISFDMSSVNPLAGIGAGQMGAGMDLDGQFNAGFQNSGNGYTGHSFYGNPGGDAQLILYPDTVQSSPTSHLQVAQQTFAGSMDQAMRMDQGQGPEQTWRHQVFGQQNSEDTVAQQSAEGFKCTECSKIKPRECDLRKHMKRHTRPYGCTFEGCDRRLGSRNDWKRHESSQHELDEVWFCQDCNYVVQSVEAFARHLEAQHDYRRSTYDNQYWCMAAHLGQHAHYRFWCGFCQRLVNQTELSPEHGGRRASNAWEQRFNHIGDHYDKHDANIDNWLHMGASGRQLTLPQRGAQRGGSSRYRNKEPADDSSELGDSGIPNVGSLEFFMEGPAAQWGDARMNDPMTNYNPGGMDITNYGGMNQHDDMMDADGEVDDSFQNL
ncbi:uncharacterized protein LTR77_001548 [Saxophila tyrrhenica]|uniref:C2H2-type domain-containing protein n=1 Tax=Saxophila tyrrhenica TaxID=1690608 RepID=A0AAV9PKE9_9PEZI|nr:hypothetical protein LTR77_001548 [Saxophila tyrrhenica]